MAKPIKDTIADEKPLVPWVDQYEDSFTHARIPVSESIVRQIATDLTTWAKTNKNALKLSEFYLDRGIPNSTFYFFKKKFPFFNEAIGTALEILGNRREIGAVRKKFDAGMISSQMAKYDKSWWGLEVQRAELKARTQHKGDGNTTYKIIVDSYKEEDETTKTDNMPEE